METTELEAQIYDALTKNAELMGMLPEMVNGDVPIYHLLAPAGESQRYPILVYAPDHKKRLEPRFSYRSHKT